VHFSSRQFADAVVRTPADRIDHAAAGERERAPASLAPQSGAATSGPAIDFPGADEIGNAGLRVPVIGAYDAG